MSEFQELRVITSDATDFLTKDQVKEFVENIPRIDIYQSSTHARKPLPAYHFEMYTKLIYDAALRSGEGRSVMAADFDLEYARMILPRTKTGWDWCSCSTHKKRVLLDVNPDCKKCNGVGKLRRSQFATYSEKLAHELNRFLQEEKILNTRYTFSSPSFPKQPISRDWVWSNMKKVGNLCSFDIFGERKVRVMKGFYTHLMRRSRAIQMDLDGAALGVISRKLRHMDIKTTTTYIRSSIGDLQKWEKEEGNWF